MLKETAHKLIPGFGHLQNYEMTGLLEKVEIYLYQTRIPDETKLEKMIQLILDKGYDQIKVLKEEKTKIL